MSKVSVITTTYRHQDFIAQTIESILSQSFTDWELLIGDDSPDNATWDVIQEYVEKYPNKIKAWHHTPNKGIVGNMNFLLEQMNPESQYVAFLEGDDLYTPDNIAEKMKIFTQYPEVALVYNNLDFIDAKGKVFLKNYLKEAPFFLRNTKLTKEEFLYTGIFYGSYSSLMIKRKILDKEKIINHTSDLIYSASDWDLFFRISTTYNCYGLEKSMTLYRRHPWNITANNKKLTKDLIILMENYLNVNKTNEFFYMLYHLKAYISYLDFDRWNTIKYSLYSFRYSLTKNFIERIGMVLFSLLPKELNEYLYKKFKK